MVVKYLNSSNQQAFVGAPTAGPRAWLLILILCCLPGMSLYDAALAIDSNRADFPATAAEMEQPANTQAAANSRDGASGTSSLLLSQLNRAGTSPTHTDPADLPPSSMALATPLTISDLRTAILGQGYTHSSPRLITRITDAPYSPRSPPSFA
jgi:hypothetical protein